MKSSDSLPIAQIYLNFMYIENNTRIAEVEISSKVNASKNLPFLTNSISYTSKFF
jgi:hypothetical protein